MFEDIQNDMIIVFVKRISLKHVNVIIAVIAMANKTIVSPLTSEVVGFHSIVKKLI